jgi:integrase/recombinase XerD
MWRGPKLYLPYETWPEDDRTRWEAAFKAGVDPFEDRGPATHLAEPTGLGLQYAWGKFLFFLSVHGPELLACAPTARVNREIIAAYVRWQPKSCGPITIKNYLHHLWMALRYLCPDEDWSWLPIIVKRIAAQANPKPEKHHLVTSETLYAVGIMLMHRAVAKAEAAKNTSVAPAVLYRDGLIIAALALVPLRRRTLAALRIGKHLVRSGDLWALDIPAEDEKTKRPHDYPLSPELSARIDLYLNRFRCRIRGASAHDYFWASNRSRPMDDGTIYNAVRRRTREALGFPVNLHRFRRAAPTLWSIRDPVNVRGAKDLLGHATFNTTEKNYIMTQSRIGGRALARIIEGKRNGTLVCRTALRRRASPRGPA